MDNIKENKPIRILHILQRMEAAGIQSFLMNIYRNIDRQKVQFDFLVQYKEDEFYDEEIRRLGGKIYKFSVREDFNLIKYKKEIRDFFSSHKEYKIIHAHMETLSDIWEKEAKRANIQTIIAHSHTAGFNEKNLLKLLIKLYYKKKYGRYASKYFACSKAAGNFMFANKEFDVIPNAIIIDNFRYSEIKRQIRLEFGLTNEFVIGHVGRFHPSKNHMFILRIAEALKKRQINAKIMLVGDGDLCCQIENEISKRDLGDIIILTGNRNDVNILYSAMDMFIMPSLFEGLPLTGVEAQASGLPCLFADTITDELAITDLAHFLPLENSLEVWMNLIQAYISKQINRVEYADIVASAGYDTKELANKLEKFYINTFIGNI